MCWHGKTVASARGRIRHEARLLLSSSGARLLNTGDYDLAGVGDRQTPNSSSLLWHVAPGDSLPPDGRVDVIREADRPSA